MTDYLIAVIDFVSIKLCSAFIEFDINMEIFSVRVGRLNLTTIECRAVKSIIITNMLNLSSCYMSYKKKHKTQN